MSIGLNAVIVEPVFLDFRSWCLANIVRSEYHPKTIISLYAIKKFSMTILFENKLKRLLPIDCVKKYSESLRFLKILPRNNHT